jgi:hypothetical protein
MPQTCPVGLRPTQLKTIQGLEVSYMIRLKREEAASAAGGKSHAPELELTVSVRRENRVSFRPALPLFATPLRRVSRNRMEPLDPEPQGNEWKVLSAPTSNRFMIVCLATSQVPMDVPIGVKVVLGRRTAPHLNNLHISREQVVIELKPDASGRILICMTNVSRVGARQFSGETPFPPTFRFPCCFWGCSGARTRRAC